MSKKTRKLILEALEDRLTPSQWGVAWPNPGHMTLSFVPDGSSVGNLKSNLFQSLGASAPAASWEAEILRAFQTWAVNANINIGVVADGGQALGASGAVQGDSRFGDIRIAMAPLASTNHLADTSGFDLSGSTWGGDMLLNSNYNFGVNGQGQYDLFTVALHEAGHSFGFGDQTTDPTSANYAIYNGPRTGLSSGDIAALQSLYGGPRSPDTLGNNSLASATFLSQPGQTVSADISSSTDAQFYSFTAPAASDGLLGLGGSSTSFSVQVNAGGISLLEPVVTVYDASGNVVGSGQATDPLNNNISIQISDAQAGATYYVQVAGAGGSVFGIGGYQMAIQSSTSSGATSTSSLPRLINNSFATAQSLSSIQVDVNSQGFTYLATGAISALAPRNYYQVVAPTLPVQGAEMLTVTASSTDSNGLNPFVTVYDARRNVLPSTVINNGNGTFTVQLTGITAGMSYYIQVSALAGAAQNVGAFSLASEFNNDAATTFTQLSTATLSQSTIIGYQSMSVSSSELVELSLAASSNNSWVNSAVRMTIYDQSNNAIFTMVASSGQPLSTGFLFLQTGNYTIRYNAATQTGAPLPTIVSSLSARVLSDPMDPIPVDPTLSGTGSTGISIGSSSGGSAGTLPLINPYSNPITNPPAATPAAPAVALLSPVSLI